MCTCGRKGDNGTRDYLGHVNPVHETSWRCISRCICKGGVLRNVGIGAEVPTDCNPASKKFVGCPPLRFRQWVIKFMSTLLGDMMRRDRGAESGYSPIVDKWDIERFMHYVEMVPESGCWVWMASLNSFGYGQFGLREPVRRPYPAHRVSYVIHHGPIEPGLVIDHKCRVRACVNPNHLQMVTQAQNMELAVFAGNQGSGGTAGENRRKTCCPKCGGDYSLNSQGWRICKPCVKKREQARYREKKNARPT